MGRPGNDARNELDGDDHSLGVALRRLRERAGLSQEALAERAGLAVNTLAALEQGRRRRPHPHTIATLVQTLGLASAEAAHVWALVEVAEPTRTSPAAVNSLSSTRVSLPGAPTPMIGREAEVAEARALVDPAGGTTRLLTLVGPGGVGKTRLALEIVAQIGRDYRDGAVFVDLAPLPDDRLVAATIAHALELREAGGRSTRELLLEFLCERQVLLVLDNCEHLLGAAPLVADLLQGCSQLTVMATSRRALGIRAERRFPVEPLATPARDVASVDGLAAAPAVRLFVGRAQAVAPDFVLDADNAHAVAAICRRLDGLPLAIELAAARVGLLGPGALLRRLERSLLLLTSGPADLPERQQTLRRTLTWSHDLLGPAEQLLFRRLAVFAGGWTLQAAEAVCASAELPTEEVLERLAVLVDASLVQRTGPAGAEPRFGMLETIREYAYEQLAAGEVTEAGRRQRQWCLALVQPVAPEPPDAGKVACLAQEQDNLRAALRQAIDDRAVEDGLWLAAAQTNLWYVRGAYTEGRAWLNELLGLPCAAASGAARANALAAAGHLAQCQGEYGTAEGLLHEAGELAADGGDELLGGVVLHMLANIARARGELEHSRRRYESALTVYRRLGHRLWEATALVHLAFVLYEQGDLARAAMRAETSLRLFQVADNTWGASRAQRVLGRVAAQRGDGAQARSRHEASLALDRALGDHHDTALSLVALAEDVVRCGDAAAARALYAESLTLADRAGDRQLLARSLEGLASFVVSQCPERAVRLAGAADALRTSLGATAPAADRRLLRAWLSAARRKLDRRTFAAAWTAGRGLALVQAVAEALDAAATPEADDGGPRRVGRIRSSSMATMRAGPRRPGAA